jgi:hypothetical protein
MDSGHQSFEGLPQYTHEYVPSFEEDTRDFGLLDESPHVYLTEYIGADCWAVLTKYTCHPDLVVEYNCYAVEDHDPNPWIFNTSHPEYKETLRKLLGRQRRSFILQNPERYLSVIDYCLIYTGTDTMIRMERNPISRLWTRKIYKRMITIP